MRFGWIAWVLLFVSLAGCGVFDPKPKDLSTLTLNEPSWDRVNVELVITKNGDCDNRGDGFISSRELVMRKNKTEYIEVPNGAAVCWRRDRNPNNPVAGAWTGWTRATLFPGQNAEADL
jgi:hypothetical protein